MDQLTNQLVRCLYFGKGGYCANCSVSICFRLMRLLERISTRVGHRLLHKQILPKPLEYSTSAARYFTSRSEPCAQSFVYLRVYFASRRICASTSQEDLIPTIHASFPINAVDWLGACAAAWHWEAADLNLQLDSF